MNSKSQLLKQYINGKHNQVEGWLLEVAIAIILSIHQAQDKSNIHGHVCEIGVHHGRLFILLNLLTKEGENAIAIDVFEDQNLNYDKSGSGDRQIFLNNIDTYVKSQDNLKVVKIDSSLLDGNKIKEIAGGEIKLFSIDGSHTHEMTYHDLNTASQSICSGGVIILDDYFNENWPGVCEGTHNFFANQKDISIVPFAIGGNKVFLSTLSHAQLYRQWLFEHLVLNHENFWFSKKKSLLCGHEVLCVRSDARFRYELVQIFNRMNNNIRRKLRGK